MSIVLLYGESGVSNYIGDIRIIVGETHEFVKKMDEVLIRIHD